MIGIVLVSHSPKIAEGLGDLIREMAPNCPLALAAGVDDEAHPIGTDAVKIMSAVESVMSEEGVVILVDLGSAILSAQTALDLLEPDIAAKTSIAPAALVEGGISAAIAAANGANRETVLREAAGALLGKQRELGLEETIAPIAQVPSAVTLNSGAQQIKVHVTPEHGLHARPAARLVATLRDFDAQLILEKDGRFADARSLNEITALQVRHGDEIILHADGKDATSALASFEALAANHFGDQIKTPIPSAQPLSTTETVEICAKIVRLPAIKVPEIPALSAAEAQAKLAQAAAKSRAALQAREQTAQKILNAELAEIFAAHTFLLEDLVAQAQDLIEQGKTLDQAWRASCSAAQADFQALDDPYLRARDADIVDIAVEMAFALADVPRPHYQQTDTEKAIWVLEELLVSQVLALPDTVVAVCVRDGNHSSHAALCCQNKGIVYLPQWSEALCNAATGTMHCIKC